jgi:Lrp/AsnC family leucine-responsive transcriptional regulator
MKKINFDNHDLAILSQLQKSARMSLSELHAHVGMSIPAVTERIRKMEARGIIRGYRALLDGKSLGVGLTAFINVAIEDPRSYEVFAEEVAKLREVQECHHVVGEFDYLLKIKTADTASLEALISREIRVIQGVGRTRTTVVLSSPIEDTQLNLPVPGGEETASQQEESDK